MVRSLQDKASGVGYIRSYVQQSFCEPRWSFFASTVPEQSDRRVGRHDSLFTWEVVYVLAHCVFFLQRRIFLCG